MTQSGTSNRLPNAAGIGYKPQHFQALMDTTSCVSWLEIHAENYMGHGGRPLAQLNALSQVYPISVHGVGLSIGGEQPLDQTHLKRLKTLCDQIKPQSFSEHLAWSTHDAQFFNDLLPLPYTTPTLERVCAHIDQVQTHLGRKMLLENPSSYLAFSQSTWSEPEFLHEIAKRTGCGLLLDINNVFVSATNLNFSPTQYIDAFALSYVEEIHLGGHHQDQDDHGSPLLIDAHGSEVADPVWTLCAYTIEKSGPRPILIEWDNDVPDWPILETEAQRATAVLEAHHAPA